MQSSMQSVLLPSFRKHAALFEYRIHRSSGLSIPEKQTQHMDTRCKQPFGLVTQHHVSD